MPLKNTVLKFANFVPIAEESLSLEHLALTTIHGVNHGCLGDGGQRGELELDVERVLGLSTAFEGWEDECVHYFALFCLALLHYLLEIRVEPIGGSHPSENHFLKVREFIMVLGLAIESSELRVVLELEGKTLVQAGVAKVVSSESVEEPAL